ncbi:hypothetical protein C2E23DRAFT_271373 [Lenzites betulinus]|nr:hypothetical protein C2E23DRAFT_271373 [Lenzites betulinus]
MRCRTPAYAVCLHAAVRFGARGVVSPGRLPVDSVLHGAMPLPVFDREKYYVPLRPLAGSNGIGQACPQRARRQALTQVRLLQATAGSRRSAAFPGRVRIPPVGFSLHGSTTRRKRTKTQARWVLHARNAYTHSLSYTECARTAPDAFHPRRDAARALRQSLSTGDPLCARARVRSAGDTHSRPPPTSARAPPRDSAHRVSHSRTFRQRALRVPARHAPCVPCAMCGHRAHCIHVPGAHPCARRRRPTMRSCTPSKYIGQPASETGRGREYIADRAPAMRAAPRQTERDAVRAPSGPTRMQMRVTPGTRRTRGEPSLAAECRPGVGRCGRRRAVACPARGRSRLPDEVGHDDGVGTGRKFGWRRRVVCPAAGCGHRARAA